MYESETYDAILQRMLDRVPGELDKRQGSVLYDALAPAAAELAQAYAGLDAVARLISATTSSGEFLTRKAQDDGMERKAASPAKRKGTFADSKGQPLDVPLGARFAREDIVFFVESKRGSGDFVLECEQAGTVGNGITGTLLPVDYVPGLAKAELGDLLVPGEDVETDESLRKRYLDRNRNPATSGNKAQYRAWALDYPGVGEVQVLPLWDGPGTVKVVILDAMHLPASESLVAELQAYLDPSPGLGEGKAPLGAVVTVEAAEPVVIPLKAMILRNGSRTLAQIQEDIEREFAAYLKGIAFGNDPSVKVAKVGALLLDVPGIQDYSLLQVADGTANIPISAGQVAVPGAVTLLE
ncbi:baseplate J/gp47 family protein [Gorillibacterium sp. CAU 1737]|uniref:baseplate J/gp47 family protein n=1 Tax=Gorillibacterium sp. CAU 1737 TaxID=3140362 RepID=UPI003260A7A3